MNFSKALRKLKHGKRVRRFVWTSSEYLYYSNNTIYKHDDVFKNANVDLRDLNATDWFVIKELLTNEEKEYLRTLIKHLDYTKNNIKIIKVQSEENILDKTLAIKKAYAQSFTFLLKIKLSDINLSFKLLEYNKEYTIDELYL